MLAAMLDRICCAWVRDVTWFKNHDEPFDQAEDLFLVDS